MGLSPTVIFIWSINNYYFLFLQKNVFATLILIFSKDWWLSSQYALLDTALSFFLFLAFIFLLKFVKKNNKLFLIFSGVGLSGAILSKGQPAIIFLFPLSFLLLSKKITIKQSAVLLFFSFLIISPWLILSIKKFGLTAFIEVFLGFAKNRSLVQDLTQIAPFYWYTRWWFESLRPAWILFFSFLIYDFLRQKINFEEKLILFYFFFSFALFSFSKNKVWWYVLPLIPIVAIYIHHSVKSYLKENKNGLINIALILFFGSLPVFHDQRNLIALILLCLYVFTSTVILQLNLNLPSSQFFSKFLIFFLILTSMYFFYKSFPAPQPTFAEVKVVGDYYRKLSQPKCLYVEAMPYEAALFYSNAEEINYYTDTKKLSKNCTNYLLTPKSKNYPLIFKNERLKLYKLTR